MGSSEIRGSPARRGAAGAPGTKRETLAPLRTKGPVRKVTTSSGSWRCRLRGLCGARSFTSTGKSNCTHFALTRRSNRELSFFPRAPDAPVRAVVIGARTNAVLAARLDDGATSNPKHAWLYSARISRLSISESRQSIRPPISPRDDPKQWLDGKAHFPQRSVPSVPVSRAVRRSRSLKDTHQLSNLFSARQGVGQRTPVRISIGRSLDFVLRACHWRNCRGCDQIAHYEVS
jgi:hypothetical protein